MWRKLTECVFDDDGAICALAKSAEKAVKEFQSASNDFGLTVSISMPI